MADKEPRRRKKRRDSQKKDDVRPEEHYFPGTKTDSRDSDQEVEEEIVCHPSHQPSSAAKIVFIILFSGLVISLSLIFISLKGADKGPIEIFDAGHEEHGEALHDEHIEEALHEEHDDHDEHEEADDDVLGSLEDFLPSLSSILSYTEQVPETSTIESEEESAKESQVEESKEDISEEPEVTTDQGILEEYTEDTVGQIQDTSEELFSSQIYPETTTFTYTPDSLSSEDLGTEDFTPVSASEPTQEPTDEDEPEEEAPEIVAAADDTTGDFSPYERADISNEADYVIREQLDEVDSMVEKSPEKVVAKCEDMFQKFPKSPRLHYIKARALDRLAENHRSNKYLEEAISWYQRTMSTENVPEKLYRLAGTRAADRLRFRGFTGKSVKLLLEMSEKLPMDVDLKNQLAVAYLLIGQSKLAQKVLLEVLKLKPDSGIAKVHLGFILKTDESNYDACIKYLREGIASREPGVIDGRFYFHLGDALHRTGRKDEALKVYEEAVKEGLFLSVYQRSLYNADGLTGKPWWESKSTRYAPDFKILERNWITIRDEALSLIDEKYAGFVPEAEGLQDKGDWKQLELFARGRKIEKNCQKAPKTCALILQIPDAASCKRGQVKFSIMHPGTHVWAHTGPTNCRLRAHLGLVVPQGAAIRVADETRNWEEGKILLFDDSFEHEVWHNGSTYRLVLIVDFWHPELTAYQRRTLTPI